MPRLSIDLSEQQHQRLKVVAALNGQSIKDYVLERTFNDTDHREEMSEEAALQALQGFLEERLQQVRDSKVVPADFDRIRAKAKQKG
jgi:hypothetical protein